MSTNRLLLHCGCQFCAAKSRLKQVEEVCERIESLAGGTVEMLVPSTSSFVDDGQRQVKFWYLAEPEPCSMYGNIPAHVAGELRRISAALDKAADAIEAGCQGKGVQL